MQTEGGDCLLTPPPESRRGPTARHVLVFFLIVLVGQNLDLWTKHWADDKVPEGTHVVFIPDILGFQRTLNPGMIWGLGRGYPGLFTAISVAAVPLIVLLFWTSRNVRWVTVASLGLILAGTLGNMFDRITIGKVRDFIKILAFDFPLFNLADSMICCGVVLLVVEMIWFEARRTPRSPQDAPAAPAPHGPPPSGA